MLLIAVWLMAMSASSQVTFNVAIPDNTPTNPNIYIAGNFNNWDAGNINWKLTKYGTQAVVYSITINPAPGLLEYKLTRGSWPTVEGDANGNYIPNRTFNYTGNPATVNITVSTWEDLGPSNHTYASNTAVIDDDFYMPQLNRYRRVWIQLPLDYYTSAKQYPVLYLHDGQNLFDLVTSFAGEWEIDETMNEQMENSNYGAIIVGIDNGGTYRIDEYCPWNNPSYGGGQGDEYIDFIVETLKPHIDEQYRTLSCREYTGIGGSSLGGLISLYGAIRDQDIFSRVLVFSPAFWINNPQIYNFVNNTGKQEEMKIRLVCGDNESTSMAPQMQQMYNLLLGEGFSTAEVSSSVIPGGQHSEWFWAGQFGSTYTWSYVPLPVNGNIDLAITSNTGTEVCRDAILTYQVAEIPGVTYQWTATGGIILSGQGTPVVQVQWTGDTAGSLQVTVQ